MFKKNPDAKIGYGSFYMKFQNREIPSMFADTAAVLGSRQGWSWQQERELGEQETIQYLD